jgi:hypothetical protein
MFICIVIVEIIMNYDEVKFKRESKVPEKDFIQYTLEVVPVEIVKMKKSYPRGTMVVIGDLRKDGVLQQGKIQSILVPRSREEIWKIVEKRDVFWRMATYEKDEIMYGVSGVPCFEEFRFRVVYDSIKSEAECLPNQHGVSKILLGDKYFKLDIGSRAHTLRHESGHVWEDGVNVEEKIRLQNSNIFGKGNGNGHYIGNFGTYNMDEAMAESFSYYIGSEEEKKFFREKYPEAYEYVKKNMNGFKWLK